MEIVTQMPKDPKPMWQSKTAWVSAVTAMAPLFYPPLAAWIALHPELFSAAMGLVFGGLRVVTKNRVVVK